MSVFHIEGSDRRKEFIDTYERQEVFTTQQLSGKFVEHFSPETGFVLLNGTRNYATTTPLARKMYALCKMSLRRNWNLRELYYTMRQTPEFAPFFNQKNFYEDIVWGVNQLEIMMDIDRSMFVQGQPKGVFFYPHSSTYGKKDKLVAQSEALVTQTVQDWEVRNALNVIAIEKMSIAHGLTQTDFPAMINAIISTTGGQFDRATRKMMMRFENQKNVMALCDGDVWGVYMVQTTHIGSKNSRHLSDKMPNVFDAGLYPSVAIAADCPEDLDEKKPLNSEPSRKRIDLLEFIGYTPEDLAVFQEQNQTFELEALNTRFSDPQGNPIGFQIYVTELMRLNGFDCKPIPEADDDLKEEYLTGVKENLKNQIDDAIDEGFIQELRDAASEKLEEVVADIKKELYDKFEAELLEKAEVVTAKELVDKIKRQYQGRPTRETYSISAIAKELIDNITVDMNIDVDDLKEQILTAVTEYVDGLGENLYEDDHEFNDFHEVTDLKDFFDVILEKIGAKPEDIEMVRNALEAHTA